MDGNVSTCDKTVLDKGVPSISIAKAGDKRALEEDVPVSSNAEAGDKRKKPSTDLIPLPHRNTLPPLQTIFNRDYLGSSPRKHALSKGRGSRVARLGEGKLKSLFSSHMRVGGCCCCLPLHFKR